MKAALSIVLAGLLVTTQRRHKQVDRPIDCSCRAPTQPPTCVSPRRVAESLMEASMIESRACDGPPVEQLNIDQMGTNGRDIASRGRYQVGVGLAIVVRWS